MLGYILVILIPILIAAVFIDQQYKIDYEDEDWRKLK